MSVLLIKEHREPQGTRSLFSHMLLDSLEVTAQHISPRTLAGCAGLQVKEQLQFPRGENMTRHGAGYQFLNKLVEGRQVSGF